MIMRINNKKAISLPETLIGLLITVFVVIGSLEMFGRGHMLLAMANHRTTAINFARARIEELGNISRLDLETDGQWTTPGILDATAEISETQDLDIDTAKGVKGERLREIIDIGTPLYAKKIIITVRWKETSSSDIFAESVEGIIYDYVKP